jgi:Spy/CpxP family protein refolding chaperone
MKKSRLWIALSLILLFAAGMVAGVLADRWLLTKKTSDRRPTAPRPPSMDRWAKDLGLTEDQQAKIKEIFKKNEERMKTLRTDFYQHLGEIRAQLKTEIDAVLTPEQRKKQEAMIQKHIEEQRKESDRRNRGREPRPGDNKRKENANEKEVDPRNPGPGGHRSGHPGLYPN